jgi:hypothetical protein
VRHREIFKESLKNMSAAGQPDFVHVVKCTTQLIVGCITRVYITRRNSLGYTDLTFPDLSQGNIRRLSPDSRWTWERRKRVTIRSSVLLLTTMLVERGVNTVVILVAPPAVR